MGRHRLHSTWTQEWPFAPHADAAFQQLQNVGWGLGFNAVSWCYYSVLFYFKSYFTFSRMRSKGSRFTLGVRGLRVCSLDVAFTFATVRNCSQQSATVRNRSQPCAAVRARLLWPCLWRVLRKGSLLEVPNVAWLRFAWQVASAALQTCRVACFCESRCQGCAMWWQRANPWQAWHFVRCDEKWRKPRTKHRFWGSKFWGSWENS